MTNSTPNVNHTMDRRREERARESAEHLSQITQEHAGRVAELFTEGMELWQRSLGFASAWHHYWADTCGAMQRSMSHLLTTTQKTVEQFRRTG
jgi:hypothetical protein